MSQLRIIVGLLALLATLVSCSADTYGATFGNTTNKGETSIIESAIRGQVFTMPEDGVATSMTAFLTITTAEHLVRLLIYKATDTALVAATEMKIVPTGTDVETTFNFNHTVNLTGGVDYILCAWANNPAGFAYVSSTVFLGAGDSRRDPEVLTSYPPDPMIPTSHITDEYSIYCTYTAGTQLTLGRTTVGASLTSIAQTIIGGIFTTPATSISVSSVTPFVTLQTAAGEEDTIMCAIYKQSDLSLVDTTYQIRFDGDTAVSGAIQLWREFTFPSAPTLAASTDYVFVTWGGHFSSSANIKLTTSGGQGMESDPETFDGTFPDPMADNTVANYYVCAFVDYEVVAGGIPPRRRKIILGDPLGLVQEATETFAGSDQNEVAR